MRATIWSRPDCTYCDQAKALLQSRGVEIEERCIGQGWTREQLLEQVPDARSVPQIFIEGRHIGGFSELQRYINP